MSEDCQPENIKTEVQPWCDTFFQFNKLEFPEPDAIQNRIKYNFSQYGHNYIFCFKIVFMVGLLIYTILQLYAEVLFCLISIAIWLISLKHSYFLAYIPTDFDNNCKTLIILLVNIIVLISYPLWLNFLKLVAFAYQSINEPRDLVLMNDFWKEPAEKEEDYQLELEDYRMKQVHEINLEQPLKVETVQTSTPDSTENEQDKLIGV